MNQNHVDEDIGVRLDDGTYATPRQPQTQAKLADQVELDARNYDLSAAAHPFACVATFAFKAAALFWYFYIYPLAISFSVWHSAKFKSSYLSPY